MNVCDDETVNECDDYFIIYEYGKQIFQSMCKLVCTASDYIKEISTKFENKDHDLSQKVTQYAHDLHILNCTYQHLNMKTKNFDCEKLPIKI